VTATATVASSTPASTSAPVSASSDSGSTGGGSTWGWWALAIVALAAVAAGTWAGLRRRRRWAQWRAVARPVARQTHVVIDLVPIPPQRPADPGQWQRVREEVEHNAEDLETVAAGAPNDQATRVTRGVATALREQATAVEALRLLEAAPNAPTGAELSQAEEVTRHARGDLDASQARLDALIGPQTGADGSPSASIN